MTEKELMIDDWVKDCSFGEVKVVSLDHNTVGIRDGKGKCHAVNPSGLTPILLTPEILEKNEWKRDLDKEWKYNNSHILSRYCYQWERQNVKIEMDAGLDGFTTSLIIARRFYAVHELQHSLRLCRKTELADNFQIWEEKK